MEQEQKSGRPEQPRLPSLPPFPGGTKLWQIAGGAALAVALLITGFMLLRDSAQNGIAQEQPAASAPVLFRDWDAPDLAIVVSGQTWGYLQPCGCSYPQYGGLARRFNFIQSLRDKKWPVLAVDLGDIATEGGPQRMPKYETAMKALDLMGYRAIGLGRNEFLMPLTDALGHYSAQHPSPRPLAMNLTNTDPGDIFDLLNVRKFDVVQAGAMKVGIVGSVGATVGEDIEKGLPKGQKDIAFLQNPTELPKAMRELAKHKVDLGVLLYQGYENDPLAEVEKCAKFLHDERGKNPPQAAVNVMMVLTREEEPPGRFLDFPGAPQTHGIAIGHKGRYVGVVGVWKKPKGLELKYQLVAIGPEYQPKGEQIKANPVMELMEQYAERVMKGNYLAKFPRSAHPNEVLFKGIDKDMEPRFVGSDKCANCHAHAHNVWAKSAHAHAFDTLVKAKDPKLRQFDGECVSCHTVGFQYKTGFYDPPQDATPKQIEKHNAKLLHVGCESCHGPCSEHYNDPTNKALHRIINPWSKAANPTVPEPRRELMIDSMCQKCHDIENDVNWGKVSFQQKWVGGGIIHMTPKGKVEAVPVNNKAP